MDVTAILAWLAVRKKAIAALIGTVCVAALQELPLPEAWRPWVSFVLIAVTGGTVYGLRNAAPAEAPKP